MKLLPLGACLPLPLLRRPGAFALALAFALVLACGGTAALAAPPEPTAAARVEAAARKYLAEQATLHGLVEPLFELNLATGPAAVAPCTQKLAVEPVETRYLNRMRFSVACPGPEGWQRMWTVRAEASALVVVAAAALPANRPLTEADLAQERRRLTDLADALAQPDEAIGLAALRPLRAGQALSPRLLAQPQLVRRGASVEIVARNGPVEVHAPGEALEAGRRGDVVRVRNTGTGRIIRARILDSALVEPENMPSSSTP